jgi:MFS transporter, Spinster family, sphingosine-1-phosphate transporter
LILMIWHRAKEAIPVSSRSAWLLVGFLGVALFLNNSDRHTVFSIFPVLKADLRFTDLQLGLTGSIFLWVYAICNPIAGQIGDRYSKRKLVTWSLILFSGVTMMTGFATTPWMLLFCRALLGVTESLFMPCAMALIAAAHGPGTRSFAANLFGVGEYVGVAMGGWFGSYVAQEFHWRWTFYSLGLLGILFAIPYSSFLRRFEDSSSTEPRGGGSLSISTLIKVPTYLFLCFTFPVAFVVFWLLYTWLPVFLYEKFSLSLAEAGFTATVYLQSANFVGSLLAAALADRLYARTRASRLWVASIGFLLTAPCLYLIGNSDSLLVTKAAAIGFGLCGSLFIANLSIAVFDVIPAHTRASGYACLNLTGSAVTGFASLLQGKFKESLGIGNMMTIAGAMCIAVSFLLIFVIWFYFEEDHNRAHQPG